jgi:hypothetical protein
MPGAAEPQRALFLHRLAGDLPAGYARLYFGSEFCPWTFPSLAACRQARAAARAAGWAFTLATPVVTEPFLPRLADFLAAFLPEAEAADEVLISDWGALAALRAVAPQATVVLGRVLSGQKRSAQILELELTAAERRYFQQGSWYAAEAVALLREEGIGRVELDNLVQGIAPLPSALAGSLHFPYAMVASSRNCPFRAGYGNPVCAPACGEVFTLSSPQQPLPLYQGGNTQFLRNDTLPADPATLGIDRLVFHPELPR